MWLCLAHSSLFGFKLLNFMFYKRSYIQVATQGYSAFSGSRQIGGLFLFRQLPYVATRYITMYKINASLGFYAQYYRFAPIFFAVKGYMSLHTN